MRVALAALLITSCATVQPAAGPLPPAVDCSPAAPCQRQDGVCMASETANELARRAIAWKECRAELAGKPTRLADWLIPLGVGLAVGAAGGAVGMAYLKH